jgi:membrane-associated protease RseP (regulator of RpoE activity)
LQLFRPDVPPVIGKLAENDVAEKAGLLPGDRVLSADESDGRLGGGGCCGARIRASP